MERIYLDSNATTPLHPEVLDAMLPFLRSCSNASSLHQEGRSARKALEAAREATAELLGAQPEQVIFTSGGTEANNLALRGLSRGGSQILISAIEHPSVHEVAEALHDQGTESARLSVSGDGEVAVSELSERLVINPGVVSVMLVNNETGVIQPIERMARIARDRQVYFHCDAVQAVGRIPVSFRKLGVFSLSLSAHKFHGPQGIGALVTRSAELSPIMQGGHQEQGMRPGTEPLALAVGLAHALRLAVGQLPHGRIRRMRDDFERRIINAIPEARINGRRDGRVPHTSNLHFPGIDGRALVMALDLAGVACSTGSACSSGAVEPSPALLAMGLSEAEARGSLRFSLHSQLSDSDALNAADLVISTVRHCAELTC